MGKLFKTSPDNQPQTEAAALFISRVLSPPQAVHIPLLLHAHPPLTLQQPLGPTVKHSPEAQTASAQRLHMSHGRFRHGEDNGCKLKAGTNLFQPVFGKRPECSRYLLHGGKGAGSTATLVAAAGAPETGGDGPGISLNAMLGGKLLLTPLGVASSCLPGHCLISSMDRPCSALHPWG